MKWGGCHPDRDGWPYEYDGYKMPPPYQGEITPDILAARELMNEAWKNYAVFLDLEIRHRKQLTSVQQTAKENAANELDTLYDMIDELNTQLLGGKSE